MAICIPPAFLVLIATLLLGGCVTLEKGLFAPAKRPDSPDLVVPERPVCKGEPQRRVLVTAFPLRYPEQIKSGGFMDWAAVTGVALSNALEKGTRVKAGFSVAQFPFVSAELAPELELRGGTPMVIDWAKKAGAQYVVAGIFKDFGVSKVAAVLPERNVRVEAYIFDAYQGKLVARREFSQQLFFGDIPQNVLPGTRTFDSTRLGKTFNALIVEMTRWAEETVTCQPFPVKVLRADKTGIQIEGGSDRGFKKGMTLQAWLPGTEQPRHPGVPASSRQIPTLVVKEAQLNSSLAEIPQQRFLPKVTAGDVLYVSDIVWRP
jgi:hypothetical protein